MPIAVSYIQTSHWHWSNETCTISWTAFFWRNFTFFIGTTESICDEVMPSARRHLWSRITDRHFLCRSCIARQAQISKNIDDTDNQADNSSWYWVLKQHISSQKPNIHT